MKISKKVFALIMTLVMVMGGAADLSAQKRKAAPARKTTTTRTTGKCTTSTRTGGQALKVAELEGTYLQMYMDMLYQGKHIDVNASIELKENGEARWDWGYTAWVGTWSVSGNTLKINSGRTNITATSSDGGRSFSGKFGSDKCKLFQTFVRKGLTVMLLT